jgi:hypothetical protein
MRREELTTLVAAMLDIPAAAMSLQPFEVGGNNRLYIASLEDRKVVVKQYYRVRSDLRDRLGAERAFLNYAAANGVACVPRMIACNVEAGIGILEHIEGTKLQHADVTTARVQEAAAFFRKLNESLGRRNGESLPNASESCFTIDEHVAMVDRRIERLLALTPGKFIDRQANQLVQTLEAHWMATKTSVVEKAHSLGGAEPLMERCISPSDFGFHNALLRPSGELCFLDFEYAGWDDPAKMAGDFFCQPAVPVSRIYFDDFLRWTMGFSRHAERLEARARLLLPVFQTKWCCIVLNDFVPESLQRRRFADPDLNEDQRKIEQIEKARGMLESIRA